jgi:hypothetical protein
MSDYLPGGVDLGLKGGCAFTHLGKVVYIFKVPKRNVKINSLRKIRKKITEVKKVVSVYDTVKLLEHLDAADIKAKNLGFKGIKLVIEDFQQRPGFNHPKSYLSTGGCLQFWRDSCLIAGVNFYMVSPVTWKRDMSLTSDKELSCKLACDMFPGNSVFIKDDNLAEAALLSHWFSVFKKDLLCSPTES